MITIKVNVTRNENYNLRTLIVIKLKLKMSTKILAAIKKCLILVIIRLSQNTVMIQVN